MVESAKSMRVSLVSMFLRRYGIWTLADLHQDALNEKYGGQGVPHWAADGTLYFHLRGHIE